MEEEKDKDSGVEEDIKFYQSHSQCLVFPKSAFKKLVREIFQNYEIPNNKRYKLSKKFLELFQLLIENYMVELCARSKHIAANGNRIELRPKDLQTARAFAYGVLNRDTNKALIYNQTRTYREQQKKKKKRR
jgi:histone H3/H4